MAQTIPLTQDKVALVDDGDYEWLRQWKWFACRSGGTFYAVRSAWLPVSKTSRQVRMHNEIMGAKLIDHRNNDGLDNRRANLRLATHSQNQYNRGAPRTNTSGVKGVSRANGKWRAMIRVNHQKIDLGRFTELVDAAAAYEAAARKYHGEFAKS